MKYVIIKERLMEALRKKWQDAKKCGIKEQYLTVTVHMKKCTKDLNLTPLSSNKKPSELYIFTPFYPNLKRHILWNSRFNKNIKWLDKFGTEVEAKTMYIYITKSSLPWQAIGYRSAPFKCESPKHPKNIFDPPLMLSRKAVLITKQKPNCKIE